MDVLGIPQDKASVAMIGVGACELTSRLVVSFAGDYIKGRILKFYVAICLILCVQNILGSLAYTYLHLVIYGSGMRSNFFFIIIGIMCIFV